MDHRWDDEVRRARERDEERRRLGVDTVSRDPREHEMARRPVRRRGPPRSPWEIGAAHYDQRDLYTQNARIDDLGYARGPSHHPEEGSYAYVRSPERRGVESYEGPRSGPPSVRRYQREAWPWLNYERRGDSTFAEEYARLGETEDPRPTFLGRLRALFGGNPAPARRARVAMAGGRAAPTRVEIYDEVNERLLRDGRLDTRDIEVVVHGGEVTLFGTVPDRASKRLAEDLAMECRGVHEVHNRLRIRPDDDTTMPLVMPLRTI